MIIAEMNAGRKIDFQLIGNELHLNDDEMVLDLSELQQEWDEHYTVFFDRKGRLTMNERQGRAYVIELDIPQMTWMRSEENHDEIVRAPIDLNTVTLTLWAVE